MDTTQEKRSLTHYPAIVVAYFEAPESAQATISDLHDLGMPAGDASIVSRSMMTVAPGSAPATGWLSRLRGGLGLAPALAIPQPFQGGPAPGSILIVHAKHVPVDAISAVCERHGASKVDTRAKIDVATHGDVTSAPPA